MARPFLSDNPGRDVQRVGTARFLGEEVAKVHQPVWGVVGTLGESQCYLGVQDKVAAVHAALSRRIRDEDLPVRLVSPAFTVGVSDGQLNGTDRMRYSLVSREVVRESTELHLRSADMAGVIAVVACDKPPVGTLAALLEHNAPAVIVSDGSVRPGVDPATGSRLDLVAAFQVAGIPDPDRRTDVALHGCPGQGSCGGMFTYNTMQTFMAVLGMEPLRMVAPASDDPRRVSVFAEDAVDCLVAMAAAGTRPRDLVTPAALRNALSVVMAMGGSTNVALHAVEIARAAGIDLGRRSARRSSTTSRGGSPCSWTCARSARGRWSTSTPPAACRSSCASCSTPACSTAAPSPAPARHSPSRWAVSARRRPTGR